MIRSRIAGSSDSIFLYIMSLCGFVPNAKFSFPNKQSKEKGNGSVNNNTSSGGVK